MSSQAARLPLQDQDKMGTLSSAIASSSRRAESFSKILFAYAVSA
jgi:hypothetical protein